MLMKFCRLFLFIGLFLIPRSGFAGDVADHAPIGVMGDHYHKKGEWMVSYRYMHMEMPQNYSGTKQLSVDQVHQGYMISPIDMTMDMHMVGFMHGITDDLTAMIMLPYVIKDMEHRRRSDGKQFSTHAQGVGDIKLTGMFSAKEWVQLPVHLNFGVSLPTGSINRTDDTLMGPDQNLPYPMQLGSGTFALLPGVTYFDKKDAWSWGFQEMSTFQLGKNEQKYRLGNLHELTSWFAYTWSDWMSTSFRVKESLWGDIEGADPRLNPNMIPTTDPSLRGGERLDLFLGVNLLGQKGALHGHRLALEVGYPVYQDLDGPQLGAGLQGTIGWQKAW